MIDHIDAKDFYQWKPFKQRILESKHNHIVIWNPGEYNITNAVAEEELASTITQANKTYRFITNRHWPLYWAYKTIASTHKQICPNKPSKLFIYLTGKTRAHRCYFTDQLARVGILEQNYFSVNEWPWNEEYTYVYWKNARKVLLDNINKKDYFNVPVQFEDSLFSVVSESRVDSKIFITEKTFIPIYHKRAFIIHGPVGIHKRLRKLGFFMFDEIFDYTFDFVTCEKERAKIIAEQLYQLSISKIEDYKNLLQYKVEHNYNHLLHLVKNQQYMPDIDFTGSPYTQALNML